jgi:hypothetical protein
MVPTTSGSVISSFNVHRWSGCPLLNLAGESVASVSSSGRVLSAPLLGAIRSGIIPDSRAARCGDAAALEML